MLPLDRGLSRIHVSGKNADDLGHQCGGWTISWQGSSGEITEGTTILEGIQEVVGDPSRVTYSRDGAGVEGANVAVAVVGEAPYAEQKGDTREPQLDTEDVALVARLHQANVPVVLVLVSGRPLVLGAALLPTLES